MLKVEGQKSNTLQAEVLWGRKIYSSVKIWICPKKRLPDCKLAAKNCGIIMSPHSMREMKDISLPKRMKKEENQPGSTTTRSGRLGTDDTTFLKEWIRVRLLHR